MAAAKRLTESDRDRVQGVIERHRDVLGGIPGILDARPGFRVEGGRVVREPSIVALVRRGRLAAPVIADDAIPGQLEGIAVAVTPADPETEAALTRPLAGFGAAAFTRPKYQGIAGDPIDAVFTVERPILCHVGPDAGWAVLRDFLAGTEDDLTVAMYDFNADYIADALIAAATGSELTITMAIDDHLHADKEVPIQTRLKKKLKARYKPEIIFCRAAGRFPSAYHEKVAVRDGDAFWISSGNWSTRSQPEIDPVNDPATAKGMYSKGNREWHLVVEDGPLAKLLARYIEHDRSQAQADADAGFAVPVPEPEVFVPLAALLDAASAAALTAPRPVPPRRLPTGGGAVTVRPLLSPDNYARRVAELIRGARERLYLQYSYITWSDADHDAVFRAELEYLAELSNRDDFDLRIIVGSSDAANKVRILAENGFNDGVIRTQSNVHNKGIVADGKRVLVSSQNWSGDGFLRNRDAGLIIDDREIAEYFETVFLFDWDNRASGALTDGLVAMVAAPGEPTPSGMVRMRWSDYVLD